LGIDRDDDFEVKAGDRMPYFTIDGKGIYDWLHAPKFHLLTFSNEAVQTESDNSVEHLAFPLTEQVAELFGSNKPFSVLLRPDNYIGFVSSGDPLSEVRAYFNNVIRN